MVFLWICFLRDLGVMDTKIGEDISHPLRLADLVSLTCSLDVIIALGFWRIARGLLPE